MSTNDENTCQLYVTPCNMPTATFDCATITCKVNLMETNYYQAQINCDPVIIIQDCDLRCICQRCIQAYLNCIQNALCNNRSNHLVFLITCFS